MLETLYCRVLDCGCPDTVCGLPWLNQYLHKLGISIDELDQCKSEREFRFGNGKTFKSRFSMNKVLLEDMEFWTRIGLGKVMLKYNARPTKGLKERKSIST